MRKRLTLYLRHIFLLKPVFAILFTASFCLAGEYAILASGFRVRAERHEVIDGKVLLHTGQGTLEFAVAEVSGFEVEECVPKAVIEPRSDQPAAAPVLSPLELIHQAAERHGLPKEFVESVARAESDLRASAVSPKGAIGLMQLMPGTAAELNVDPLDPAQNADGGTRYLRDLLIRYLDHPQQVRLALAAYNAGPGAVDRYRGVPPYRETQQYVKKVLDRHKKRSRQP